MGVKDTFHHNFTTQTSLFMQAFTTLFPQASGLVWLFGQVFSFSFYTDKPIEGVSSDLGDITGSLAIISDFIQALKVSRSVCTDFTGIQRQLPKCFSYKDSNDIVLFLLLLH